MTNNSDQKEVREITLKSSLNQITLITILLVVALAFGALFTYSEYFNNADRRTLLYQVHLEHSELHYILNIKGLEFIVPSISCSLV